MTFQKALLLVCAAGAMLAACGGAAVTQSVTSSRCDSPPPPALLYPAPNASGIPYNHTEIWVGYAKNPTPPFSAPALSAPSKQTVSGSPWAVPSPGPLPPGILPLPPGDTWWDSLVQSLAQKTTYSVTVTESRCGRHFVLGHFTTS